MSHQRFPSHDPVKEKHSVSLKVLRLSRPSLVSQHPLALIPDSGAALVPTNPVPASLAYSSSTAGCNPDTFILSPVLNLPPSFGSAYVGETFSCTLCANHDGPEPAPAAAAKKIRDVRLEAEMKTPTSTNVTKLELGPADAPTNGVDLGPGQTLQKVVNFDLREEGNHVLAVTVSYYESTETNGRARSFRKLYQFISKASLIVRTKAGPLPPTKMSDRRWVLEAQLENCSEDAIELDRVELDLDSSLAHDQDCNWERTGSLRPLLHPGEIEQVCFVVEESKARADEQQSDGKLPVGVLGIGWRNEMGNKGFLRTGALKFKHQ